MRLGAFAGAAALTLTLSMPASAHSVDELDAWVEDWRSHAGDTPDAGHVAEWLDMKARHPWYFAYQPPQTFTTATESAQIGGQPSPGPVSGGVEQWRSLVAAYFPADQVDKALQVMACESGGNPNADNPTSSAAGLFQFLKSTWDNMVPLSVTGGSYASGQVYDPEANVRAAAWLLAAEGWSQWSCA